MPLVLFPQGCIYRKRMIYALESAGRAWHAAYHSHSLAGVQAAVAQDWASACCRPTRACRVRPCWAGRGFEAAPATELAIVGEHRGLSMAHRDLIGALEQAIGGSCAV